jgi:hypothetical protein
MNKEYRLFGENKIKKTEFEEKVNYANQILQTEFNRQKGNIEFILDCVYRENNTEISDGIMESLDSLLNMGHSNQIDENCRQKIEDALDLLIG